MLYNYSESVFQALTSGQQQSGICNENPLIKIALALEESLMSYNVDGQKRHTRLTQPGYPPKSSMCTEN